MEETHSSAYMLIEIGKEMEKNPTLTYILIAIFVIIYIIGLRKSAMNFRKELNEFVPNIGKENNRKPNYYYLDKNKRKKQEFKKVEDNPLIALLKPYLQPKQLLYIMNGRESLAENITKSIQAIPTDIENKLQEKDPILYLHYIIPTTPGDMDIYITGLNKNSNPKIAVGIIIINNKYSNDKQKIFNLSSIIDKKAILDLNFTPTRLSDLKKRFES